MSKFKKILVAIDFSNLSEMAMTTAVDLAKDLGADLHIVHIVQIHATNIPEGGMVNIEEIQALEEQSAKNNLEKFLQDYGEGLDISTTILHGDAAVEVNNVAKEAGADMIVMGTHGRKGVAHLLMGSVAESVLRKSEVPVLCIRKTG